MSKKFIIVGLVALVIGTMGWLFYREANRSNAVSSSDTKHTVVATFYPLGYIAESIAGDRARVSVVVPPGTEPHDFEPSPLAMAAIESADVFIMSGTEIDAWADRLVPVLQQKGVSVIKATDAVTLAPATLTSDDDGVYDPHFWLDLGRMVQVGQVVTDALAAQDRAAEPIFRSRFAALASELQTLDDAYFDGLRTCASRDIVVSHDAFQYLALRYNLSLATIAGISPEQEPSSRQLADIVALVKEKNITTIFGETLMSPILSETIARETGATTDVLNPIEGLTGEEIAQGKNYQTLMRDNLLAIRRALVCQ